MQPPTPYRLSDPLGVNRTDSWRKIHKQLTVTIADQTRSETIPKEIKFLGNFRVFLFPNVTTNNLCFLRMKLKLAFPKTFT
jgi:hypothetical protein